jgi:hypothetical protein
MITWNVHQCMDHIHLAQREQTTLGDVMKILLVVEIKFQNNVLRIAHQARHRSFERIYRGSLSTRTATQR